MNSLNPTHTALLVIDVQQGLFAKSTPIFKAAELLHNLASLIDQAHSCRVPVFYIQHSDKTLPKDSSSWQLHPQLHPQPIDFIVHKQHGNAFEETNLGELLLSKNITTLVVTGLVTHGCVRATCLGARQLGYTVTLVADAHSSYSKDATRLIDEWHHKLAAQQVALKPTSEIEFA